MHEDASSLARQRRALIARRLAPFAAGWTAVLAVWLGVFALEGRLVPAAVVAAAVSVLALATVLRVARAAPTAPRIVPLVVGTCIVLGLTATGLVAAIGAYGEILAFLLLTLYLAAALLFCWGWRAELALLAGTLIPWLAALQRFPLFVSPLELAAAVAIGSGIALAVAEGTARDLRQVQRRRRAQEEARAALQASRDAYRDLAERAPDMIWACDREGRMTYVNEALTRFIGLPASAILGRSGVEFWTAHVANPDFAELLANAHGPEQSFQVQCATAHGPRWMEIRMSVVHDAHGTPIGFRGVNRDVQARHDAEEALERSLADLRQSEETLRLLARRQVAIREEERKRLGFDLHDDVCQELVGIGILVESVRWKLPPMTAEHSAEFDRISAYLGRVVEHLRLLARDMRPALLQEFGLEGSLRSLAAGLATDDLVVVTHVHPVPRFDEDAEVSIYRIGQEALTNAVRHAAARAIVLVLAVRDGVLVLEVRDDGYGFDPASRPAASLGLASMEERALALGGRLEIRSAPGKGTVVALRCPIAPCTGGRVRVLAAGPSPTRSSARPSRGTTPQSAARD